MWVNMLPGGLPTCVAEGIVAGLRKWVSSLICVEVNGPHAQKTSSALGPADVDGVADAPVCQPAGVADVRATLPGQVELTGVGQLSSTRRARRHGLGEGELLSGRGVENSPCIRSEELGCSANGNLHESRPGRGVHSTYLSSFR